MTMRRVAASLLLGAVLAFPLRSAAQDLQPSPERQRILIHLLRQDCGSCHGLRLKGGLGPALTRSALAGRSAQELARTILEGRPGTAMPAWRTFLEPAEARWLAQLLLDGDALTSKP